MSSHNNFGKVWLQNHRRISIEYPFNIRTGFSHCVFHVHTNPKIRFRIKSFTGAGRIIETTGLSATVLNSMLVNLRMILNIYFESNK
jgi:hypothetical protein